MHKILDIFKKQDQRDELYPWALEKYYTVSKKVLGTGSFAVVKLCTDKRTGNQYALKIINKKSIQGRETMLTTELNVLKKVDHPNVVALHDLFETKNAVYIITDLASGGELFTELLLQRSFTEKDAAHLIRQVLEGVAYLHDHEIVHRDLKPENLLFKDKGENPRLMITDFGLSKILRNHNDILMTACGTPGYVAPEVLSQVGHGKPVDLWSIGVIMYTLLCGYAPFWGENQAALFEAIMSGKYEFEDEYWSNISELAKDLIRRLLTYSPKNRITAHQALLHPWFKSAANVDLLHNVRNYVSARTSLKKIMTVVKGVVRLERPVARPQIASQTLNDEKSNVTAENDNRQTKSLEANEEFVQTGILPLSGNGTITSTISHFFNGSSSSGSGERSPVRNSDIFAAVNYASRQDGTIEAVDNTSGSLVDRSNESFIIAV